jgi:L-asparaginase/Glu-tRNA(Gln) amidotransferase subunit D
VNEELATQEGKLEKVQVERAAIDTIVSSIAASAYDSTCNLISEDLTDKIMEHQAHEVEKAEESEIFASGGSKVRVYKLFKV